VAEIPIRSFLASVVALRKAADGYQVLLLKRTQTLVGEWCQIAGNIEAGETAWQTAIRELKEETGLTAEKLYSADICEQFYEADRDAITMAPVFVAIINLSDTVELNHEHSDHCWVSFEEAIELVTFAGQRRTLRQVHEEFVQRSPSVHLLIDMTQSITP